MHTMNDMMNDMKESGEEAAEEDIKNILRKLVAGYTAIKTQVMKLEIENASLRTDIDKLKNVPVTTSLILEPEEVLEDCNYRPKGSPTKSMDHRRDENDSRHCMSCGTEFPLARTSSPKRGEKGTQSRLSQSRKARTSLIDTSHIRVRVRTPTYGVDKIRPPSSSSPSFSRR